MLDSGYNYKINIMFHERPDYFQECIDLAMWCDDHNVKYTPRVIGDQGDVKQGLKDNTIHTYTPEQITWMKQYWKFKKSEHPAPARAAGEPDDDIPWVDANENTTKKSIGQQIGRPCCGGRNLDLLVDEEWTSGTFVHDNNFKGWNCMVNWYFLYIHQEIDAIWHHQTCQVNLDGEVAPISTVTDFGEYCDKLESQVATGSMPYIRCPKTYCGCGLCAPKAKHDSLAKAIFSSHAPHVEPKFMDVKEISPGAGSLKSIVYKFDKDNGNETI